MPRPMKHPSGRRVLSISIPEEVYAMIESLPNRSEYIAQLVKFDLGLQDMEKIDGRLAEINEELFSLEKSRLTLLKEKNTLEARKNTLQRTQGNQMNERLKVLEFFQAKKATEREMLGWLQNRLDVLKECGFESPSQMLDWLNAKLKEAK
ncbi:MAG TPA: hypothetical protein PLI21_00865 [Methanomassiliicoccaceae archaeon]|nr:hypothetical protein [Methanomassiliicoccaceae archaeon]